MGIKPLSATTSEVSRQIAPSEGAENAVIAASFEGRQVTQITDFLPSILLKIIQYVSGDTFAGTFPPVAQVSKLFRSLYLQTIRQFDGTQLNSSPFSTEDQLTEWFRKKITCFPRLAYVTITSYRILKGDMLMHLQGLTELQKLDLKSCIKLTDTGLAHLHGLTGLQKLNLWECTELTDAGKRDLKAHLPKLNIW